MTNTKLLTMAIVFGAVSCWTNFAFAIAIYDNTVAATLSFNQPWISVATDTSLSEVSTSGSGLHQESTSLVQASDLANLLYSQAVTVSGSAGNVQLSTNGQSVAVNSIYTLLTFNFGSTPTDFSMMYSVMDFDFNHTTALPFNGTGERAGGGGGGTQLALDGTFGPWYTVGQQNWFYGLTGQHTVRLWTGVDGAATARYPYVDTPEPSTVLLGLISAGAIIARKRFRRSRSTPTHAAVNA
jgi:hypothetical protein